MCCKSQPLAAVGPTVVILLTAGLRLVLPPAAVAETALTITPRPANPSQVQVGWPSQAGKHAPEHQGDIEGLGHLPTGAGDEGVRDRVVGDDVSVMPPACREAGIEIGRRPISRANHDARRTQFGQPSGQVLEVEVDRQIATHHLPPGVHTGIGSA